jgi:hypothetical protein
MESLLLMLWRRFPSFFDSFLVFLAHLKKYGIVDKTIRHHQFHTATVVLKDGLKIDIATARLVCFMVLDARCNI